MAYSSIHFARVRDARPPRARVDGAGQAFLTVEDGAAQVTFSDRDPERLVAFLYSLAREAVRALGAAELEREPQAGPDPNHRLYAWAQEHATGPWETANVAPVPAEESENMVRAIWGDK